MPNAFEMPTQKDRKPTIKDKQAINAAAHKNLLQEIQITKEFAMQHDLYKTAEALSKAAKVLMSEAKLME